MRRSHGNSIRPGALEGEGQIQTMDAPSEISGMTRVSGFKPTAIGISDSGKADSDGINLNVGVMRPESVVVVSAEGENKDYSLPVAPEVGQEDVHDIEEKEDTLGIEEELEGEGEELEAVISESCSVRGIICVHCYVELHMPHELVQFSMSLFSFVWRFIYLGEGLIDLYTLVKA